jgi:hypothetical protein
VLLAELTVRHSRRHMPTRRVALERSYVPTSGPAHGVALLGAVVEEFVPALDDDGVEMFRLLLDETRAGLVVPSIALRHRLQTDVHGLDRSRHRLVGEAGRLVLELDVHGAPVPQLLGAVLAASGLPPIARHTAVRALQEVVDGRRTVAPGIELRRFEGGFAGLGPPPAGIRFRVGAPPEEDAWAGVAPDRRWALEVLGLGPATTLTRAEVNRRYRRLLRDAHPDHGGAGHAAAERIAELAQARVILLALAHGEPRAAEGAVASSGSPGGQ